VVDGISALNDKSEPGPRQLTVVDGISALNDKSVVEMAPEEEAEEDAASGAMNE
jgi:hypothetical protein